jgi:hypothetical protein
MPLYLIEVSEITHQRVRYTVEADSSEEAKQKALAGDTVDESLIKNEGVLERHSHDEPELVEASPI